MTHWLLEPEVFQEDSKPLIAALEELEVPHTICRFGESYDDYIDRFKSPDKVFFYGSLQFGQRILKRSDCIEVYCNLPRFECLYYYPRFGDHLLNSGYVMLPFGDLNRRKEWLLGTLGDEGRVFVRPSSGYKTFTGLVLTEANWDDEVRMLSFRLDPEVLLVAAPYAYIKQEWRSVVVDKKVVATGGYKYGNANIRNPNVPVEVVELAKKVVGEVKYNPDPAWTLDICETWDGRLKVLEVGSLSCAGLYAVNCKPIVQQVNEMLERE